MDTVKLSVYESAVKGRKEFREAFRQERKRADAFGLALMMISKGLPDPEKFATDQLARFTNPPLSK